MVLGSDINRESPSLEGMHATVDTVTPAKAKWRNVLAFMGPAYLISVGYMDPGNWATDLAAGSRFQYALIWVLLLSNIIALLMQYLSAKLGIVRARDLAQCCRETYSPVVNMILYVLAEIAIAATDLAEVIGMAIGLNLLVGLPLLIGVPITILDTFLLLAFQRMGMRKMEAFIIALIAIIGISFLVNLFLAQPDLALVAGGFIPSIPDSYALYIAIGIIGATVMPHNLYLHSALVQTRKIDRSAEGVKKAVRYNLFDSALALNLAFLVNAAIMVLAAATFYSHGFFSVEGIEEAHRLLEPLLGSTFAPLLFAIALIAAGQSSTITSTLTGQVVMEGYLRLRIRPWLRRLLTRSVAIVPAFFTVYFLGTDSTTNLLILSQVILSLQLGFAVIPLIHFVSDKQKMGDFAIGPWIKSGAWIAAAFVVMLNIQLVWNELTHWMETSDLLWLQLPVIITTMGAGLLLIYITLHPVLMKKYGPQKQVAVTPHGEYASDFRLETEAQTYRDIAISVDFSDQDHKAINQALSLGGNKATYHLIHVVESAGALLFGKEISDEESQKDQEKLHDYITRLQSAGFKALPVIGYGSPPKVIVRFVQDSQPEILVMGAHGHKTIKDLIFGQTVDYVRHHIDIPVLVV